MVQPNAGMKTKKNEEKKPEALRLFVNHCWFEVQANT